MKLSQRKREIVGLSMLVSAVSLCVTFIVLSFRKKSVWQALLAIAAAECAVGSALLIKRERCRTVNAPVEEVSTEEEELFTPAEAAEAQLRIRSVLGGTREGEVAKAPSLRREIPRDEEATEADFQ
ncbi:MAG: hypothetical protein E7663_02655 [Ruminococcaceae bacterium]|nr:hypothetical protein [Oscillospiraceae bacterium]